MKKTYETPEMTLSLFETESILASGKPNYVDQSGSNDNSGFSTTMDKINPFN